MHVPVVLDTPDRDHQRGADYGDACHDDKEVVPEVLAEGIGKEAYAEAGKQHAGVAHQADQAANSSAGTIARRIRDFIYDTLLC